MADQDTTDAPDAPATPRPPSLEDLQHWTWVMGRAQQMMMEHLARQMGEAAEKAADATAPEKAAQAAAQWPAMNLFGDPAKLMEAQAQMWAEGLGIWQRALAGAAGEKAAEEKSALAEKADRDKRFAAPEWRDNPLFDTIRQTYLLVSDRLLGSVDAIEGVDAETREKMRFLTRSFVDAMAPSNFALTNPQVLEKAMETKGESLLKGLEHMLGDLSRGQLTHTESGAFEVGRNIAMTPGKVVDADAALPADPICAGDRAGAGNPADHLPALDQPLLHSRSEPEEELHQMGGRAGAECVHRLLEVGRREHEGRPARRLCPRPDRGDRHRPGRARRRAGPCDRLLRGGDDAGGDAGAAPRAGRSGQGGLARPSSPRRSIFPRRAI